MATLKAKRRLSFLLVWAELLTAVMFPLINTNIQKLVFRGKAVSLFVRLFCDDSRVGKNLIHSSNSA